MTSDHVILVFQRSPEEPQLAGVDEVVQAMGPDAGAKTHGDDSLIGKALRFWFPYLSRAGIAGVTPDDALRQAAETCEVPVMPQAMATSAFVVALGTWLQNKQGRKLRAKFGGSEIEAQTLEEARSLFARLESLRGGRDAAAAEP